MIENDFYTQLKSIGWSLDTVEQSINSSLFKYLNGIWTSQHNILVKGLESAKTYEELKYMIGKLSDIRTNLSILRGLVEIVYPTIKEEEENGQQE